jgi:hypothetical protein
MHRRLVPALLAALLLGACQLPARGTPVFVDMRAGNFWSGNGKLLEVSDDQARCLVSVRGRSMVVKERWVDCAYVHSKSVRHSASPKTSFK